MPHRLLYEASEGKTAELAFDETWGSHYNCRLLLLVFSDRGLPALIDANSLLILYQNLSLKQLSRLRFKLILRFLGGDMRKLRKRLCFQARADILLLQLSKARGGFRMSLILHGEYQGLLGLLGFQHGLAHQLALRGRLVLPTEVVSRRSSIIFTSDAIGL